VYFEIRLTSFLVALGVVGTVTTLVNLWADTGQLPSYMRQGRRGPA
jgi:hypothetical protein